MKRYRFIAVCREGDSILGYEQIWEADSKEPLEIIIKRFLKTGYLHYTKTPSFEVLEAGVGGSSKPKIIRKKLYPQIDKLYLWEVIGRVRKRPAKLGGNIIEGVLI